MSAGQQTIAVASAVAQRVEFTVSGKPVAKERPRFARRGNFVATYTPEKTANYETLVKFAAAEAMQGRTPFAGAVRLIVDIVLPIPSSWSAKKQAAAEAGLIGATKKPDWTNVIKGIEDGMNGVVYVDDGQIVNGWVSKRYGRAPRVRIEVCELNLQKA